MLESITVNTYNDYLKIVLNKNNIDDSNYKYYLIRYTLDPTSNIARSIMNNIYTLYMSYSYNMGISVYMANVDLESNYLDKIVTEVTDKVRYYDFILDNTINKDDIYVYIIKAENTIDNTSFVSNSSIGYLELQINSFGIHTNPMLLPYYLKHRGVADIDIINSFFDMISKSMFYINKYIQQINNYIYNILKDIDSTNNILQENIEILNNLIKLYFND